MNISREDAEAIVEMADVCWSEGQGGLQGSILVKRLYEEFGRDIGPGHVYNDAAYRLLKSEGKAP